MDSRRRKAKVKVYLPYARIYDERVIDDRPHPISKVHSYDVVEKTITYPNGTSFTYMQRVPTWRRKLAVSWGIFKLRLYGIFGFLRYL